MDHVCKWEFDNKNYLYKTECGHIVYMSTRDRCYCGKYIQTENEIIKKPKPLKLSLLTKIKLFFQGY